MSDSDLASARTRPPTHKTSSRQARRIRYVPRSTDAANRPRAATATPATIRGNPRRLQTNYRSVHRPASVLEATAAENPPGVDELSAEDEERIARVSLRLRSQVNRRRVQDLASDLPPVSGEFAAQTQSARE